MSCNCSQTAAIAIRHNSISMAAEATSCPTCLLARLNSAFFADEFDHQDVSRRAGAADTTALQLQPERQRRRRRRAVAGNAKGRCSWRDVQRDCRAGQAGYPHGAAFHESLHAVGYLGGQPYLQTTRTHRSHRGCRECHQHEQPVACKAPIRSANAPRASAVFTEPQRHVCMYAHVCM